MPETGKPDYDNLTVRLQRLLADELVAERLNVDQMFILIEGVLPIEACLYYQVLPLFLDGSRLHLGMVCPTDTAASDYVRRIVSYLNYSLVTRQISSEALQIALSAFLKHADRSSTDTGFDNQADPGADFSRDRTARGAARDRANQSLDPALQTTLIVDSPEELGDRYQPSPSAANRSRSTSGEPGAAVDDQLPASGPSGTATPEAQEASFDDTINELADGRLDDTLGDDSDPLISPAEISSEAMPPEEISPEDLNQTQVLESFVPPADAEPADAANAPPAADRMNAPADLPAAAPDLNEFVAPAAASGSPPPPAAPPRSPSLLIPPLTLTLKAQHLEKSVKELGSLPASDLLQELLARTLATGIGRLYFERQPRHGRILWSESGVLRSVIDRVPLKKFQAIIIELKRLAQLPLIEVQTAQQAEIERIYSQTRILLRFRFIPSNHGEQATLQVLRGAALKFYQQQQISRLGRDALTIARQLQTKVNEIRDRARLNPDISMERLAELQDLISMLQYIEQQVEELQGANQAD